MFSTDQPIDTKDDDLLGRGDFARRIAEAITNYQNPECLTIGIYGGWGSGKTSLANMILNEIIDIAKEKGDIKYCIIKFNPWLFSNQKDLITQLFSSISDAFKLSDVNDIKDKAARATSLVGKAAKYASHIPVPIASEILKDVSEIFEDYSKILKGEQPNKTEYETLTKLKEKISKTLKDEKIKLIISIDDFDRLSQDEIRLMFQVVKVLGDFNNTVYLLLLDKGVVVDSLKNVQGGNGEDYLKKIIQVPIALPPINTDVIQKIIRDKFYSIIKYDFLSDNDKELLIKPTVKLLKVMLPHIKNIRDVNRVINLFEFKYGFIKDDANPLDILALCVIEISVNALYNVIMENKYDLSKIKSELEIYKFLTSKDTNYWSKFNNPRFNNYFGRIEYLDMYFSLELSNQHISSAEKEKIIFKYDIQTIERIIGGHLDDIPLLLESIEANISVLKPERCETVFQILKLCFKKSDVSSKEKITPISFRLIARMSKEEIEWQFNDFKNSDNDKRKELIFFYTDILIYLKKEKCEKLKEIFINIVYSRHTDAVPDIDISKIEEYYISALDDINIFDYKYLKRERLYELCKEVDINYLKKMIPADYNSEAIWNVLDYEIYVPAGKFEKGNEKYEYYCVNIDTIKKLVDIEKLREFLRSSENYSFYKDEINLHKIVAFLMCESDEADEKGVCKVFCDGEFYTNLRHFEEELGIHNTVCAN